MKSKLIIGIVVGVLLIIMFSLSTFVVNEKEQVVITQFGRPVGDPITEPGLHFKIPFVQTINFFDKRFLEWDGDPNQVPTKEKKYIFVDTYARWRITDPLQFFKRLTNERGAQSRIDDILDGETRNFVASHKLEEIVRSSNRQPVVTDTLLQDKDDSLTEIHVGRKEIQDMILASANKETKELGIEILDFRFKRINYVEDVRKKVYNRMRSERFRIADKFRSEGQGEASRINGEKERELKSIQSEAFRTAEEIKGDADAEAASIYAKAYNRNVYSRDLYSFLKSMETLKETFNKNTNMILSTDSELYQYLKSSN